MARRAVRYAVIDAFTDTPFKGNPAVVCLLDGEDAEGGVDDQWMLSVAKEFNISVAAFLTRACSSTADGSVANLRFHLRWFTPVTEVKLCGHGTLAAAHFLLTSGLVECDVIEFITKSGLLIAKKVHGLQHQGAPNISFNGTMDRYSIELDLPVVQVVGYGSTEFPSIPETLNGVSVINVRKTTADDLIIELASGKEVADLQPNFAELEKCAGRGVIITGLAPAGSGFDFFTRFFCPKLGVNEFKLLLPLEVSPDGPVPGSYATIRRHNPKLLIAHAYAISPNGSNSVIRVCPGDGPCTYSLARVQPSKDPVCGSAHCALAPYWSKKLGKQSLVAYMASPRSGILDLQLEEKTQRVRIKGDAVTVMVGTILGWYQPSNVSIDL